MKNNKGFTLIELLVVIAIIGILAAVVLASLNNARSKGGDAALKANMASIRPQAELYYDIYGKYRSSGSNDYEGDCTTSSSVFRDTAGTSVEAQTVSQVVNKAIQSAYDAGAGVKNCRVSGNGQQYMVAITMNSNRYWCVDNLGTAKDIGTTLPATGINYCP